MSHPPLTDRDAIRYALGQILDYRHLLNDDALSYRLLLPARPWASLIELLHAHEIGVTWRDGSVWMHEPPPPA